MIAIEILRNEHAVIIDALNLLERHARDVAGGRALDVEFARWVLLFTREFADDTHHAKEEGVLFGLLERLGVPQAGEATRAMRAEHDASRDLARALEQALEAGDATTFAETGRRLADLLRRHVLKENDALFGIAEQYMTPADDATTLEAFGKVVHARDGVLIRQRHLAAIERWRVALGACACA